MSIPPLKYGDLRHDGYRFLCVQKKTGTAHWLSPAVWEARKAGQREYHKRNQDRNTLRKRESIQSDPEKYREYKRSRYWSRPEKMRKDARARGRTPSHKAMVREYRIRNRARIAAWHRRYQQINRAYFRAVASARRAYVAGCIKKLSEVQRRITLEIYRQAQRVSECLGIAFHVDHIHPLIPRAGREAGVHEPSNLQILAARLNLVKSNRSPEETLEIPYV
jgi:hypothetical protein